MFTLLKKGIKTGSLAANTVSSQAFKSSFGTKHITTYYDVW